MLQENGVKTFVAIGGKAAYCPEPVSATIGAESVQGRTAPTKTCRGDLDKSS